MHTQINKSESALTPVGLELFMKLGSWLDGFVELGPSISTISMLEGLGGPIPIEYPSPFFVTEADSPPPLADTSGSEANAGGGALGSGDVRETGWLPNKFFSKPVCITKTKLHITLLISKRKTSIYTSFPNNVFDFTY